MFEVGKTYTIKMWEPGEHGGMISEYPGFKVVEIPMPLVKFVQFDKLIVLNTASLAFLSAEEEDPRILQRLGAPLDRTAS